MESIQRQPILQMKDISKKFGPVPVLQNVQLTVYPGEVHLLAGENGAGKSTLINILGGVITEYEGCIELQGRPVRFSGPLQAGEQGISVIHQELSLIPAMSVAENMFLGRFPGRFGFVDRTRMNQEAARVMSELGWDIDVRESVERFPLSVRQLIEIAKSLIWDTQIIVMDEPSSALNAPDVRRLFELIDRLKRQNCGIIYITHKMEEIERIADRITVLRDGKYIGSSPASELSSKDLIRWMIGREENNSQNTNLDNSPQSVSVQSPPQSPIVDPVSPPLLQLEKVEVIRDGQTVCQDISFSLKKGEVIGLAGLQGAGNSFLLEALFGVYGPNAVRGNVLLNGRKFEPTDPQTSLKQKFGLLPNDRKEKGLVLSMSVTENMNMVQQNCPECSSKRLGFVSFQEQLKQTRHLRDVLNLKATSLEMEVGQLSGGNQQKVALGKWMLLDPQLLFLDEPTRGVDIGAKQDIYSLITDWKRQGIGLLLITSEMPELLALSDRILVMHRGRISGEFGKNEFDSERILAAAM